MDYKKLEIWQLSRELVIEIHSATLMLPFFENNEVAKQIRRSIKSVKSNIVEGYGRRAYKQDFIRFLNTALASNFETLDHWETLFETKSFKEEDQFYKIHNKLNILSSKITAFINAVKRSHNSFRAHRL